MGLRDIISGKKAELDAEKSQSQQELENQKEAELQSKISERQKVRDELVEALAGFESGQKGARAAMGDFAKSSKELDDVFADPEAQDVYENMGIQSKGDLVKTKEFEGEPEITGYKEAGQNLRKAVKVKPTKDSLSVLTSLNFRNAKARAEFLPKVRERIAVLGREIAAFKSQTKEGRAELRKRIETQVSKILDARFGETSPEALAGQDALVPPKLFELRKIYEPALVDEAVKVYIESKFPERGGSGQNDKLLKKIDKNWAESELADLVRNEPGFGASVDKGLQLEKKQAYIERYGAMFARARLQVLDRQRETIIVDGHTLRSENVQKERSDHYQTYSKLDFKLQGLLNRKLVLDGKKKSGRLTLEEERELPDVDKEVLALEEELKPYKSRQKEFDQMEENLRPLTELYSALRDEADFREEKRFVIGDFLKRMEAKLTVTPQERLDTKEEGQFNRYKEIAQKIEKLSE